MRHLQRAVGEAADHQALRQRAAVENSDVLLTLPTIALSREIACWSSIVCRVTTCTATGVCRIGLSIFADLACRAAYPVMRSPDCAVRGSATIGGVTTGLATGPARGLPGAAARTAPGASRADLDSGQGLLRHAGGARMCRKKDRDGGSAAKEGVGTHVASPGADLCAR